jgi:hypothetical protein
MFFFKLQIQKKKTFTSRMEHINTSPQLRNKNGRQKISKPPKDKDNKLKYSSEQISSKYLTEFLLDNPDFELVSTPKGKEKLWKRIEETIKCKGKYFTEIV